MGLYHRYEPQAKASRLNGKSERFYEKHFTLRVVVRCIGLQGLQ